MNLRVVLALATRYIYLYRRNPVRLIELIFWPTMELLLMGFLTVYLQGETTGTFSGAIRFLLGAVILWDVLFRSQQAVALSFLEDVWTRNLLNIFVSPIRDREYLAAMFLVGVLRISITITLLGLIAWAGYGFSLFVFEWRILPFLAVLMVFGWSLGMISTALILRWGLAAEGLAWAIPFLVQPFTAVFYPVSALPVFLQLPAWLLPSTWVFEGMRATLGAGPVPWGGLLPALAANATFALLASWFFARMMRTARQRGLLTRIATQ